MPPEMKVPAFTLERQNILLKEQIMATLSKIIDSGKFILGENVKALEDEIAEYCGAGHAVGVASGSDALYLALQACEVEPGDEVITTPFTFYATAGAIQRAGAKPVFVDIEHDTWNINPTLIKEAITSRTKAILPVHLYGCPADTDSIMSIAEENNLYVIEDAAQAVGATYKGRKTGTLGHVACFSFFPTKNLGSYGDGGIVVSNDKNISEKIRILRVHGSSRKYFHDLPGCNSRLDEIQAGVIRVKMNYINEWTDNRRKIANLYIKLLLQEQPVDDLSDKGQPDRNSVDIIAPINLSNGDGKGLIKLPIEPAYAHHVYHQFTIQTPDRDQLQSYLTEQGIGSTVYYPSPMHLQKTFSALGYREGDFPITEQACHEVLSLPMFPELTEKEVVYTAEKIKDFLLR